MPNDSSPFQISQVRWMESWGPIPSTRGCPAWNPSELPIDLLGQRIHRFANKKKRSVLISWQKKKKQNIKSHPPLHTTSPFSKTSKLLSFKPLKKNLPPKNRRLYLPKVFPNYLQKVNCQCFQHLVH